MRAYSKLLHTNGKLAAKLLADTSGTFQLKAMRPTKNSNNKMAHKLKHNCSNT